MRSLLALMLLLAGCTTLDWTTQPRPEEWVAFMARVNALDAAALDAEYRKTQAELGVAAEADDRLRLAYLLSRPALTARDPAESRKLLSGIPSESAYAPIRDLMMHELAQLEALDRARLRVRELESQLDALKSIDAELTEEQAELEELSN
jgi:hypothetical protein